MNIKPCPFCKSVNTRIEPVSGYGEYEVYCTACGASGPHSPSESGAVTQWNAVLDSSPTRCDGCKP